MGAILGGSIQTEPITKTIKTNTMQVAFTVHAAKLDFFKESKDVTIIDAIQIEDSDSEMYRVTFEFPEYMTIGMICQFFLHSGISYGLDLKYSSYDNNISR